MKKVNVFSGVANVISYLSVIGQANELFELIQLIVSILGTLAIVVINVWKWYNDAKKDGKITNDELDDLAHIISKKESKDGRQNNEDDQSGKGENS